MQELIGALEREADRLQPHPDLGEVLRRSATRRRRRRLAMAGGAVALAAVTGLGAALTVRFSDDGHQVATTGDVLRPVDLATVGGPSIGGAGPDQSYAASSLERVDRKAATGPWTVVLRRRGGGLGDGTAAITYPVSEPPSLDDRLVVTDHQGVHRASIVRDLGPARVKVVAAGLSDGEVRALADRVRIVDGRPVVADDLSDGETGLEMVATGPNRPPLVAEARYGCDSLGEAAVLGGLCYAGLTTAAGFVAALYGHSGYTPGPELDGQPTAVSGVGGGNGTLAWEIRPGVIAFVGYSGAGLGPDQIAALHRLATRFVLLPPEDWAATNPQVVEQENSLSG